MPCLACILVPALNLPTTELLVQPPPVRTVSHLDVRQPFRRNGYESRVESNGKSYEPAEIRVSTEIGARVSDSGRAERGEGYIWPLTYETNDEPALPCVRDLQQSRP